MTMKRDWVRDSLIAYELIEDSDSIEDMNENIRYWIDLLRNAAYDLCMDNEWDESEIDID